MGKLRLSVKERARAEVLSKASELLGVSYRQVLRLWERYKTDGAAGLKHGLRDWTS